MISVIRADQKFILITQDSTDTNPALLLVCRTTSLLQLCHGGWVALKCNMNNWFATPLMREIHILHPPKEE